MCVSERMRESRHESRPVKASQEGISRMTVEERERRRTIGKRMLMRLKQKSESGICRMRDYELDSRRNRKRMKLEE